MLRIALIEDFFIFRLGVSCFLSAHFENLHLLEIESSEDYGAVLDDHQPNLIILGINNQQKSSGLILVRQVRRLYPDIPIIVYDTHLGYFRMAKYLKENVNGYLLKHDQMEELIPCIYAVLAGKQFLSPTAVTAPVRKVSA